MIPRTNPGPQTEAVDLRKATAGAAAEHNWKLW